MLKAHEWILLGVFYGGILFLLRFNKFGKAVAWFLLVGCGGFTAIVFFLSIVDTDTQAPIDTQTKVFLVIYTIALIAYLVDFKHRLARREKKQSLQKKEQANNLRAAAMWDNTESPDDYETDEDDFDDYIQPKQGTIFETDHMDGQEFERWCADLLQDIGFQNVSTTRASGDQGVDIVAEKSGRRYAIQCKRYSQALSNKPIQEVYTGKRIYKCDIAVVMTNNYFTQGAIEAAEQTGVLLWDRNQLKEFIKLRNL